MFGEAWASLAEKVFGWATDERGLKELQKRRKCEALKNEIKQAIARKDFNAASIALSELERLSDSV